MAMSAVPAIADARCQSGTQGVEAPAPDVALETREFYAAYHRALTLLSNRERVALLLRWEEEFTFEQIAKVLGVSTVGAHGIVLRGQQRVREALADYRS